MSLRGPRQEPHGCVAKALETKFPERAEAAIDTVRDGQGVTATLSYQVASDLAAGTLVRILQDFENCSVPILHKAGEVSVEKFGVQHWCKNNGKTPAVLSSDVFHEMGAEDEHMM